MSLLQVKAGAKAPDVFNVVIGTIWQTCLVLLPMYVVLLNWRAAATVVVVIMLTSYILKRNWYDMLERETARPGMETAGG